jgi:hypothetical protein
MQSSDSASDQSTTGRSKNMMDRSNAPSASCSRVRSACTTCSSAPCPRPSARGSLRNGSKRFVDDPAGATASADDLIKVVMRARGYTVEDFDQRVADLSVEHANVVQHYRAARALSDANREGRANTEELRQALVHYRALFADVLEPAQQPDPSLKEARA